MTQTVRPPHDVPQTTAVVAAPGVALGDPGPLGLSAFALTTFFLSTVNAGILPKSVEVIVLGLALFYGGITQLFAGMWEFAKGNTFGAVAFASYGAFWLSFWYLVAHTDLTKAGADAEKGIGTYLLGWTIFTGIMLLASLRVSGAVMAVFAALFLTFLFLSIGALGGATGATKIGGYLGLLTAAIAWYAALAAVFNSTARRAVLPTWPR